MNNLELHRGDDLVINGIIKNQEDGQAINLTGSTLRYGLSEKQNRNSLIDSGNIEIINAVNGEYKLHIDKTVTTELKLQPYYLDIELTDGQGITATVQVIITILYDNI